MSSRSELRFCLQGHHRLVMQDLLLLFSPRLQLVSSFNQCFFFVKNNQCFLSNEKLVILVSIVLIRVYLLDSYICVVFVYADFDQGSSKRTISDTLRDVPPVTPINLPKHSNKKSSRRKKSASSSSSPKSSRSSIFSKSSYKSTVSQLI